SRTARSGPRPARSCSMFSEANAATNPPVTVLLAGCTSAQAKTIQACLAAAAGQYCCEAVDGRPETIASVSRPAVGVIIYALPPASKGGLETFLKVRTQSLDTPMI